MNVHTVRIRRNIAPQYDHRVFVWPPWFRKGDLQSPATPFACTASTQRAVENRPYNTTTVSYGHRDFVRTICNRPRAHAMRPYDMPIHRHAATPSAYTASTQRAVTNRPYNMNVHTARIRRNIAPPYGYRNTAVSHDHRDFVRAICNRPRAHAMRPYDMPIHRHAAPPAKPPSLS